MTVLEQNNSDCLLNLGKHIESIRNRTNPRLPYDPIRFREQLDFISQTFYSVVGNGQSLIYKMRQPKQELNAIKVSKKSIYDTVYRRFKGFVEPILLLDTQMLCFVPAVAGERYEPSTREQYMSIDHSQYANTYIPPKYTKQTSTIARPAMWQLYLDRLMPPENLCWYRDNQNYQFKQQDYFEQWLSQRIQQPQIAPEIAIVLRGDQGTGKSFAFDILLKTLLGESNYKAVSLAHIKDKYKASLWSSVLLQIEELNDSKKQVGEILKQLITQPTHLLEQKHQPSYQAKKHFGIVITSNEPIPLQIENNDRRYFVPNFSKIADDTQRFFEELADWLEYNNGYQEMYDHFNSVDLDNFDIRKAPYTREKSDLIVLKTASESKHDIAMVKAYENKDCLFMPIKLSEYLKLDPVTAQQALRNAGFEPYETKRRWVKGLPPIQAWKHKDTDNPKKIWLGDDNYFHFDKYMTYEQKKYSY